MSEDAKRIEAKKHVRRLKGFYQNLWTYITINIVLLIINLIMNPHHLWFYWVTIFWGIAILMHAFRVFGPGKKYSKAWEEKKIKDYMDKH